MRLRNSVLHQYAPAPLGRCANSPFSPSAHIIARSSFRECRRKAITSSVFHSVVSWQRRSFNNLSVLGVFTFPKAVFRFHVVLVATWYQRRSKPKSDSIRWVVSSLPPSLHHQIVANVRYNLGSFWGSRCRLGFLLNEFAASVRRRYRYFMPDSWRLWRLFGLVFVTRQMRRRLFFGPRSFIRQYG